MTTLALLWMLLHLLIHIGAICTNNTSLIDLDEISTDITVNKFRNTNISSNMPMADGKKYTNFITLHPSDTPNYGSTIWPLNGEFSSFTAIIGLSLSNTNCINKYGSDSNYDGVIYKFYIDDILTYTSPQIQYASEFDEVSIDTTNGINLKVEIYKLNSAICDIAVIANPILNCKSNIIIDATVFVTETSQISTTNLSTSSGSSEVLILIIVWSVVLLAICVCIIFVCRARRNKNKKLYQQTINNSSPMAVVNAKDEENEMQPLGAANNSKNTQYIHAAIASDTFVVHEQMDTMANIDEIIATNKEIGSNNIENKNDKNVRLHEQRDTMDDIETGNIDGNKNDKNDKLSLDNNVTGSSEVVDLYADENDTHVVKKHSVMETITNLDVGSLPNFDDEMDSDENELKLENYNTGTNSDKQHSTQNTTVINHSSVNTVADIDTQLLPKFDDDDEDGK